MSLPGIAHLDDGGVDQDDNDSDNDDEHKFLEDLNYRGSAVHVRCSWIM